MRPLVDAVYAAQPPDQKKHRKRLQDHEEDEELVEALAVRLSACAEDQTNGVIQKEGKGREEEKGEKKKRVTTHRLLVASSRVTIDRTESATKSPSMKRIVSREATVSSPQRKVTVVNLSEKEKGEKEKGALARGEAGRNRKTEKRKTRKRGPFVCLFV
jgi:hypothetical protein